MMSDLNQKWWGLPIRHLGVFLVFLLMFSAGGIRLVPVFSINLIIFAILLPVTLSVINRSGNIRILFWSLTVLASVFLLNFLINKHTATEKLYLVYSLNALNAIQIILFYKNYTGYVFADDLYLALKIYLFHALAAFFLQFIFLELSVVYKNQTMTYKTFAYLFYYTHTNFIFYGIFNRNTGLFWEPGVLQIFMNLTLFIAWFIRKDRIIAILAAVAVLSTFSTTGLLILAFQVAVMLASSKRRILYGVLFLPVGLFLSWLVADNVTDKVVGEQAGSFVYRAFFLEVTTNILLQNPWFGVGPTDADQLGNIIRITEYENVLGIESDKEYLVREVSESGNSNSWLVISLAFGLPLALLFFFSLYRQTIFPDHRLLVFVILGISLSTEAIADTSVMLLFILSAWLPGILTTRGNTHESIHRHALLQPGRIS
ncbi:MAG: O-antigen ligase family protein [Bacteroidetes bacterium]|nr:O-antigen ligase family protein [Bacteroidota bacterium]